MTTLTDELAAFGGGDGSVLPTPYNLLPSSYSYSLHEIVTNILVFTGVKGSSKTCQLARMGLMGMALWKMPVFCDFPLGGDIWCNVCHRNHYYEAQPLPNDALVNYAQNLPRRSMLIIDELQEWFDRQDWSSVKSKLGVSMGMQIRKLDLMICGAIQFFNYLNPRLNDQVDVLCRCSDFFFTPWGKEVHIRKGTEAHLQWFDLSGAIHGTSARSPFNPRIITGEPFAEEDVCTEALWRYFDTTKLTAIEQRFIRWQVDKEVKKIDPTTGNVIERAQTEQVENAVQGRLDELKAEGKTEIRAAYLHDQLKDLGITMDPSALGRIMTKLGRERQFKKDGTYYTL